MDSSEFFKALTNAAFGNGTANTVIFVGLAAAFSLWALLFFANGCAIHIHEKYDMNEALWYKKSMTSCKIMLLGWSVIYALTALTFSIAVADVGKTFLFALICAGTVGIGASLLYNLAWYAIALPCLYFFRKRRK